MHLELKILNADSPDVQVFGTMNEEAFPDNERMSMSEIFEFVGATNTDFIGIYDESIPIGYIVLLKNDRCGYVFFYAIGKEYRSKGYGGAALKELFKKYSDLQIILDFEQVDEAAANNEQRIRRKNFYLRNGFNETGRYTLLKDERFEVVCNGKELDVEGLRDIIRVIHSHVSTFPDVLL